MSKERITEKVADVIRETGGKGGENLGWGGRFVGGGGGGKTDCKKCWYIFVLKYGCGAALAAWIQGECLYWWLLIFSAHKFSSSCPSPFPPSPSPFPPSPFPPSPWRCWGRHRPGPEARRHPFQRQAPVQQCGDALRIVYNYKKYLHFSL